LAIQTVPMKSGKASATQRTPPPTRAIVIHAAAKTV
jgi:hypothetical protein